MILSIEGLLHFCIDITGGMQHQKVPHNVPDIHKARFDWECIRAAPCFLISGCS